MNTLEIAILWAMGAIFGGCFALWIKDGWAVFAVYATFFAVASVIAVWFMHKTR